MKKFEKNKKGLWLLSMCAAAILLNGCASPGKGVIPPAGDMTMAQIYYQANGMSAPDDAMSPNENVDALSAARALSPAGISGYKGGGGSDLMGLNKQFKTLPNPQILVYVSPHLVTTQNGPEVPVPGYVTSFFMYPQNEFAMPYEHY